MTDFIQEKIAYFEKNKKVAICEKHGEYFYLENKSCPHCKEEQEKLEQEIIKNNMRCKEKNIPIKYWGADFKPLENQKELFDELKDFNGDKNLMILGKVGTGKTHLVCARLKELSGFYISMNDLFNQVTDSFTIKMSKAEIFNNFINKKILVIDEIGRKKDYEKELLFDIINYRYNRNLFNILISNLDIAEFAKFLGSSSFDRLREKNKIIKCDWESFRK